MTVVNINKYYDIFIAGYDRVRTHRLVNQNCLHSFKCDAKSEIINLKVHISNAF